MEDVKVILEKNGDRKEIFHFKQGKLTLTATNKTIFKQIEKPRRRIVKEESSIITCGNFKITNINRHIRPGETDIPELNWLKDSDQLYDVQLRDCKYTMSKYLKDAVGFVDENNFFHSKMRDYWCFDSNEFKECLEDFCNTYNLYNNASVKFDDLLMEAEQLEENWNDSFNISETDLIKLGVVICHL